MKRDLELARKVLLEVEKQTYTGELLDIVVDGYTPEEVAYHILLLSDGEYLVADYIGGVDAVPLWLPSRLTWKGFDALDLIRDDKQWADLVHTAESLKIPLTFDTVAYRQVSTS